MIKHARKSVDRERTMGFTMQAVIFPVKQMARAGLLWARGDVYSSKYSYGVSVSYNPGNS